MINPSSPTCDVRCFSAWRDDDYEFPGQPDALPQPHAAECDHFARHVLTKMRRGPLRLPEAYAA